ncbi:hypothetical protein FOZ60_012056 [Perkinsus olseni]|uniref:Core-binding (CB) domain-containing protein n=1 Tax=Perkinsus olseni TaxID=32597 RepID=A0A7J6NDD2_PEROL|nr:hypothetical protein FOZ60_012056 [Perkinsus olseni]
MNQQIADECYAHLAASLPLVYGGGTLVNPSPSSGVPAPPSRSPQSSTTQLSYKPNPSDRRASQPYTHPYGIRRPVKVRGSGNRGIPTVDAETVQTVLGAARAQSTNRKYDSIVRRYTDLLNRMNVVTPWPLSGHSLTIYISALTREGKVKAETIEDYVGKLRCVGKQFSEGLSGPESELVRLALQGSKRILGWSEPVRARTLSATELATLSKLEPSSGRACAVAAYLVGVCGLLRLREVAELRVSDVEWRESQASRFAVLNVRHSKTDQRGPALRTWTARAGASAD